MRNSSAAPGRTASATCPPTTSWISASMRGNGCVRSARADLEHRMAAAAPDQQDQQHGPGDRHGDRSSAPHAVRKEEEHRDRLCETDRRITAVRVLPPEGGSYRSCRISYLTCSSCLK